MAVERDPEGPPEPGPPPSDDPRADYDYASEDDGGDLVEALRERVDGEIRFDEFTRNMYATDASAYEVTPVGVVFPRHAADVERVVGYCADEGVPVLPRGGGTSLAGQAVNEAVVLDFTTHMDGVREIDAEAREVVAEPGVRLGDLNDALADDGLKFAPDPAWGERSALGGAIGNNSTGSHSLKYGKTDAYIEELEVVLADGTRTTFGEVTLDELRERADPDGDIEARVYAMAERIIDESGTVRDAYPNLKRNVSGYNLDRLVEEAEAARDAEGADGDGGGGGAAGTVNLARLLAGSEGTLAVVTEARVSLEPVPETKSVALLAYEDLVTAMRDVAPILEHDPAAVEVLDDVLLELAGDTSEFGDLVADTVPEGAGAMLLVEFYAESDADGRRKVADLFADRYPDADSEVAPSDDPPGGDAPVYTFDAQEAHDDDERARFWKLRKSGLPILLSRTTDAKHISFIEDTAVPPENLPEYVSDFQDVLEENGTFASFYAHAGPGVLHIRPLIDTKQVEGVEAMRSIAESATDLVVKYGGSVSGEHGDGRARTVWNRKLYGDRVFELFRELKTAFDPDWLLNPGQVCGDVSMTENLRFSPEYEFDLPFEPALEWDIDNGMQGMVELCHGCGGCRGPQHTTGGTMCPTYRAAEEESLSTRGRANLLRDAMTGDLETGATDPEFLREVMDLCIGCKGCKNDCPSEVDMAKLKAEVEHAAHQEEGASLRARLFANIDAVSRVGSALAPVVNRLSDLPGSDRLAEWTLGIARERDLPAFANESFVDWFDARGPRVPGTDARRRVLLLPDTFTNYVDPEVAKDAVRVLEAAGVHVRVPDVGPAGRAAHSTGFLDLARERARDTVEALEPDVAAGWDVVAIEPSDAVMVQSDYRDLLGDDAAPVADSAYGLCEYLDRFRLDGDVEWTGGGDRLVYHGHCHQKAHKRDHHAVGVLRRAGYEVEPLDSGCCGMAGSFGYEAEHYSMSTAIGGILDDQIHAAGGDRVIAPGASCRSQLKHLDAADGRPPHPVEALAEALPEE